MLAGVEPLTLGEDSFTALISEVDSDEDYQIVYEQSIWELTYDGEILHTQPLPEQYKGVDNAMKVIDDAVYYLRTTEDKVELVQLNEAILAEERVSRLVEITPIIEEPERPFPYIHTYPVCAITRDPFYWHTPCPFFITVYNFVIDKSTFLWYNGIYVSTPWVQTQIPFYMEKHHHFS